MTMVSAPDGSVVALCTGPSVYTLLPPRLAGPLASLAPDVGTQAVADGRRVWIDGPVTVDRQHLVTIPVPLTTHIYDRTGEHLLYTLADERRGSVPRYEWCSRPLDLAWRGSTGRLR